MCYLGYVTRLIINISDNEYRRLGFVGNIIGRIRFADRLPFS